MAPDHISTTMTYSIWCEEHFWNASVLQVVCNLHDQCHCFATMATMVPRICMEDLRKTTKNFSRDTWSPGLYLNLGPPKYEAEPTCLREDK
jgi:hypothetical protein